MSLFDYVTYNEFSQTMQKHLKEKFESIASDLEALGEGRSKCLALNKLEEAYMWVGKALRDNQLEEERIAASREKPE